MMTSTRIAACMLACGFIVPQSGLAQSDVIRTKKSQFRIPFAFEREEYSRIGAQEVQLFLSTNAGETWQHVQSALPTAEKFRYNATKDGEHWFSVRTLDRNRNLHPEGKLTPGLKVLVDTSRPEVSLKLREADKETVRLSWMIADIDPDPKTLRIEYKTDDGAWKRPNFEAGRTGSVDLVATDSESVTVRFGVRDRAGNVGVAEKGLRLSRSVAKEVMIRPMRQMSQSVRQPDVQAVQYSASTVAGPSFAPQVQHPVQLVPQPAINELPTIRELPPEPTAQYEPVQQQSAAVAAPAVQQTVPQAQPLVITPPVAPQPPAAASQVVGPFSFPKSRSVVTPTRTVSAPVAPGPPAPSTLQQQPVFDGELYEDTMAPEPDVDPALPRIVNQLQFRLDYSLEELGPSGVSSVDIYITEDGGQKWWRYGEDMDKKSPVILRVPRDGKYGFIIGAKSGVGLGDPAPGSGDAPHAVVIVDRDPPKARFDKVAMNENGRTLDLDWKTADGNAHRQPVRLEYSAGPTGPWVPMDNWAADSGHLSWAVPRNVPSRIHVRMLVRDAAGNIGQIAYPQPVLVDVSRPRARITNVKISRPRQ